MTSIEQINKSKLFIYLLVLIKTYEFLFERRKNNE